jgi:hypothetical protein
MSSHPIYTLRFTALSFVLSLALASSLLYAQASQDSSAPPAVESQHQSPAPSVSSGWPRIGDRAKQTDDPTDPNNPPDRSYGSDRDSGPAYPQTPRPDYPDRTQGGNPRAEQGPNYQVPAQLTIKRGTFITVSINQRLSSDHNQAGDSFSATLARPLVVDGVVVAQPGQTIGGRVAEAQKAGRVSIETQLIGRRGPTSVGQDAGTIVGTSAVGAAIGAIAGRGEGAGIGAAAGAAVGTAGVLLTRGHATVIYPESLLTFRIEAPVTFSTERSSQAFRYVDASDYDRSLRAQSARVARPAGACGPYGCPPPPPPPFYYGPTYYYGPAYPYYYGPTFSYFVGPRFYYGPQFYGGRGYYRGYHR